MSTQPRHDICPEDGRPCWTEPNGWRCGTSLCGRKEVYVGVDLSAKGDRTTICEIEQQPGGTLLVTDILELPVARCCLDMERDLDGTCANCGDHRPPIVNRGRKREPEGQSALPPFRRYSIPETPDPKAVACPYCVRRPRNLQAHCRAMHPDKPEAR